MLKLENTVIAKKAALGDGFKGSDIVWSGSVDGYDYGLAGKCINNRKFCLCDPITQLCMRIEAFFRGCPGITCSYKVNNNVHLDWKKDDHGDYITGVSDEGQPVFYSEDHVCEFRLYVENDIQAQCLANVIRHRHVVSEEFGMGSPIDGSDAVGRRNHILNVKVFKINGVDPMDSSSVSPFAVITEVFGTYPIRFDELPGGGYGEVLRGVPDASYPGIPMDAPEEYEQLNWETGFRAPNIDGGEEVDMPVQVTSAWKWKWLKEALRDNKNIIQHFDEFEDYGGNEWRFIECSRLPVVFQEDNLSSSRGFNSILAADLIPVIFAVFGSYQIATYARQDMVK